MVKKIKHKAVAAVGQAPSQVALMTLFCVCLCIIHDHTQTHTHLQTIYYDNNKRLYNCGLFILDPTL